MASQYTTPARYWLPCTPLWIVGDRIVTRIGSHNLEILGLLNLILKHEFHNVNKLFRGLIHDVMYPVD
ncbi:hypothetical protein MTR_8g078380 [Medicago truncatula]|uniref:Uncharacterized protein n=1 Tax=Medicago truncatula TaxID=3880 RepID=G7LFK5_MEDTR|nr:hypothetical protein MTR_8g078380 [Medicago truncatula]